MIKYMTLTYMNKWHHTLYTVNMSIPLSQYTRDVHHYNYQLRCIEYEKQSTKFRNQIQEMQKKKYQDQMTEWQNKYTEKKMELNELTEQYFALDIMQIQATQKGESAL
eukprot:203381_1